MNRRFRKSSIIIESLRSAYSILRERQGEFTLSRTACFGNDTQFLLTNDQVVNHQKSRSDLLLKGKCARVAPVRKIRKYVRDEGILPFIEAQSDNIFGYPPERVSRIFFDSYSDLVDCEFVDAKGRLFYAVKGDIDISALESSGGRMNGLMNLESIKEIYEELFSNLHNLYSCPIFFLHFPTKFEWREEYKARAQKILEATQQLAVGRDFLRPVVVPDHLISQHPDGFVYHMSDETKLNAALLCLKAGF